MSHVIVNLTLPIVVAKVESVLNDTASENDWESSRITDLRQHLTAYVLRRLPVIYVTLDQDSIRRMGTPSQCYSYDQHRQIDRLIEQGLQTLLDDGLISSLSAGEDNAPTAMPPHHRRPQEVALASSWFG